MNSSWTLPATSRSGNAATILVGRSRATSSAWLGPYRTPSLEGSALGSTSRRTPLVVSSVSFSMPFATDTTVSSGVTASSRAPTTDRTDWLGTATSHTSAPSRAARMSDVTSRLAGSSACGKYSLWRVVRIASAASGRRAHSVTAWRDAKLTARAVPQLPAPRTAMREVLMSKDTRAAPTAHGLEDGSQEATISRTRSPILSLSRSALEVWPQGIFALEDARSPADLEVAA